jgi:peptide deformylase
MLRLVKANDPVLRQVAAEVLEITPELQLIAQEMRLIMSMAEPKGLALAAPQVGKPIRMIVTRIPGFTEVMLNPVITEKSERAYKMDERCMSLPGLLVTVSRPDFIQVEWLGLDGKTKRCSYSGLNSRCIQHTRDILDGILIGDINQ